MSLPSFFPANNSNATFKTDPEAEIRFVDYIATLPGLKRYFPSEYSPGYTTEEAQASRSPLAATKERNVDHGRARGIPQTLIRMGVFEPFLFVTMFTGIDLGAPSVLLYGKSGENQLPITSLPYLATALAELVQRDPESLADIYTIVEYGVSGNDAVAALEKATGKKVTVSQQTDEELEEVSKQGPTEALASTTRLKWGTTGWTPENPFNPEGVPRRSVLVAVQDALKTGEGK